MIDSQTYRIASGSHDAIPVQPRSRSAVPCAARISRNGMTGWCVLEDGHDGDCAPVLSVPAGPSAYGPGRRR